MATKKFIQDFYKSEALINSKLLETYLHPDFIMEWNGHNGILKMNKKEWLEYTLELERTYIRFKAKIIHLLVDKDLVSINYSLYVRIVENPREELYLTDFMTIWEMKDDKFYRCYQMSRVMK